MCLLPPLRSPPPVKPPPFRHRNSPSCEMKVPELKIATRGYLYCSRKDASLHSRFTLLWWRQLALQAAGSGTV